MSATELLRLALSRLRTSRLRAALTMLGVIIGVASVVALVSVGQGTTTNITDRLSELGTNLLTISPTTTGITPTSPAFHASHCRRAIAPTLFSSRSGGAPIASSASVTPAPPRRSRRGPRPSSGFRP